MLKSEEAIPLNPLTTTDLAREDRDGRRGTSNNEISRSIVDKRVADVVQSEEKEARRLDPPRHEVEKVSCQLIDVN